MTFQPYQEETEEIRRQGELPLKLLKQGTKLASYALGGSSIVSRILPLLNKFVPPEIAKKGLSKINPQIGKFINSADKAGYPYEDTREFLEEKFQPALEEMNEEEKREKSRLQALSKVNERLRKPRSELSREGLQEQFEQGQQGSQGKETLLQTMQQITDALKQMRGNG